MLFLDEQYFYTIPVCLPFDFLKLGEFKNFIQIKSTDLFFVNSFFAFVFRNPFHIHNALRYLSVFSPTYFNNFIIELKVLKAIILLRVSGGKCEEAKQMK